MRNTTAGRRVEVFCVLTVDGFLHIFETPFFGEADDKDYFTSDRLSMALARTQPGRPCPWREAMPVLWPQCVPGAVAALALLVCDESARGCGPILPVP